MSIKIYNSLSRKKEEFKPLRKGKVSMYVCGPTVYGEPHIGHVRSAYIFDVIRRYFESKKYKVKFVRNVTDIDDKIINKAKEEFKNEDINIAVKKVSEKYLKAYHECIDELGIKKPTHEPKATEYIKKMIAFIQKLIKKGVAYESGGDVYFDITKAIGYGKLSNQSLEMLESGSKKDQIGIKHNQLDFALWKKAKPDERSWNSPWGQGRPGWHIECSVMSSDILGSQFDIHGGGIDLIFPHHENEIAQSEGAGGKFARYWIHNGLLTINKEKMAKSLGNFITINELEDRGYPLDVLKLLFLQSHYSHPVDFTWERMEELKKAYERILILVDKAKGVQSGLGEEGMLMYKQQFTEAMDDDFNAAKALAVLFDLVARCNKLLESDQENKQFMLRRGVELIKEMGGILGLSFKQEIAKGVSVEEIDEKVKLRSECKQKKKFDQADSIRKDLEAKGIILEDTKDGTTWRRKL
ncbi:MAG: cysteine--tRNA ligase [Candidatus Omnitrophica bacterium]|nr:cysteine--tRNA ligase [Candidatus Omnitrophota bacterium]